MRLPTRSRSVFALLLLLALGHTAPGAPPRYSLKLLAPPDGLDYAVPFRIGEQGELVGYAAPEPYHPLAVAFHVDAAGNAVVLPTEDDSYRFAFGLSGSDTVLGQSGRRACVWEAGEQRFLKVPEGVFSGAAADGNRAGLICGNFGDSDEIGPRHCAWPDAGSDPVPLIGLFPPNNVGMVWAVNEGGQMVGSSGAVEGGFIAARWDAIGAEPIPIWPLEGAFNSEARSLNEAGDVVGRSSFQSGAIQAFLYRSEGAVMTGLPFLAEGETYSEAFDVNDHLQVVGTARRAPGEVSAVLWQDGEAYDLNDLLFEQDPRVRYLSSAGSINSSGQICAEAVVGEGPGDLPRWIAVLTPVFLRGDTNGDRGVDIADPIGTLEFLFLGGTLGCLDAADGNDDGQLDVSDPVYLLAYLFTGGPTIPPPHPAEGIDPTFDPLSCRTR